MEEKIRRLSEDLEQRVVDRTTELELVNKELESFSQSVSHDLRAPLRNLAKLSQILVTRYSGHMDTEGRQYLYYLLESSQQALQLVSALMDLSKVTRAPLHTGPVDLTACFTQLAEEFKDDEPERKVIFKIAKKLSTHGDPSLIKVALQNLLENSWKFTSKNKDAVTIELGSNEIDGRTVFFVRDNGVGYDPDYAYKLFHPFQRLHSAEEFQGTGVGLTTVQRIMHRHGGRIWSEGAVDKGATFYFCFPPCPAVIKTPAAPL